MRACASVCACRVCDVMFLGVGPTGPAGRPLLSYLPRHNSVRLWALCTWLSRSSAYAPLCTRPVGAAIARRRKTIRAVSLFPLFSSSSSSSSFLPFFPSSAGRGLRRSPSPGSPAEAVFPPPGGRNARGTGANFFSSPLFARPPSSSLGSFNGAPSRKTVQSRAMNS
jgi:hypothetical protein